jgi:predicted flap endonuclease-1-like 5' DNA nuclease
MTLKIIGFLIKVIKLAFDTFVEKPVKVRAVRINRPNKNWLLWGVLVMAVAAIAVLLRWFLKPLPSGPGPVMETHPLPRDDVLEVQATDEATALGPEITLPDDLALISGIGPKTANLLVSEGITTYQKLADKSQEDLVDLLKRNGFRIVNPATWPKQAALAAAGNWDGLKNYLNELKQNLG